MLLLCVFSITCVVLPVRHASNPYALASGLVEAASAGLLVSFSGSATYHYPAESIAAIQTVVAMFCSGGVPIAGMHLQLPQQQPAAALRHTLYCCCAENTVNRLHCKLPTAASLCYNVAAPCSSPALWCHLQSKSLQWAPKAHVSGLAGLEPPPTVNRSQTPEPADGSMPCDRAAAF